MTKKAKNQKWLKILPFFIVLFVLFRFGGLLFYAITPYNSEMKESFFITVKPGQTYHDIAQILEQRGVIGDPQEFYRLGRWYSRVSQMKVGEYEVSATMTPLRIMGVLSSGISVGHRLTIREGENMYQVADKLVEMGLVQKRAFLVLCKDKNFIQSLIKDAPYPPTLEGFLFPDTYFFNRSMKEKEMITRMVSRFYQEWGDEEEARAKEIGMDRNEVVTLASIIEKETGAPHERPLISSVFHNRLKKKMVLATDPTVIYGIWERYDGNIRKRDLRTKTPYNTYKMRGLPPGAISNPGKESLLAALYPEKSDYYYFVSQNDGTHQFSETLEQHNAAVRKFQLDPKAREGKSWRDLNKNSATE